MTAVEQCVRRTRDEPYESRPDRSRTTPIADSSDTDLVLRAQSADRGDQLNLGYRHKLPALAKRFTGNYADAEDRRRSPNERRAERMSWGFERCQEVCH